MNIASSTNNISKEDPTLLNIQADDFFNQPKTLRPSLFSSYPLLAELNDTEDSYSQFKQYTRRLNE
jgi:hypothetical protein